MSVPYPDNMRAGRKWTEPSASRERQLPMQRTWLLLILESGLGLWHARSMALADRAVAAHAEKEYPETKSAAGRSEERSVIVAPGDAIDPGRLLLVLAE